MRDVFLNPLTFTRAYLLIYGIYGELLALVEFLLLALVPLVHGTEISHNAGVHFYRHFFVRHKLLQGYSDLYDSAIFRCIGFLDVDSEIFEIGVAVFVGTICI
jgi:hypothetical protein